MANWKSDRVNDFMMHPSAPDNVAIMMIIIILHTLIVIYVSIQVKTNPGVQVMRTSDDWLLNLRNHNSVAEF